MEAPIWLTILTSLLSGLVAYICSTQFYLGLEIRREKLSILREIMANRHGLTPNGNLEANACFFKALNSVYAVFHNSQSVVSALDDFKKHPERAGDNVTQLIRRMSEDLKIDTSYLDDDFFKAPFIPKI